MSAAAVTVAESPLVLVDADRLRIAIMGAPHTGKTTLAYRLAGELPHRPSVLSTDSYSHLGWHEASDRIAELLGRDGWRGIVEGVRVPHVLRKMLRAARERRPVDRLIILETVHGAALTPRQRGVGQAGLTVLMGPVEDFAGAPTVLDELRRLGVEVEVRS